MGRPHALAPSPRNEWNPSTGRPSASPCKRACCWTPLGHSTVRDALPDTDPAACRCHTQEKP